jgi:two-component system cell cycle sensor histidine kinase/response regulator CckA
MVQAQSDLTADSILEALPQAVIATDVDGTILYWNRAAEQLYGWSSGEVIGSPISSLLRTEKEAARSEEIMKGLRRGKPWAGSMRLRRRDGEVDAVVVTAALMRGSGDQKIVAFLGVSTAADRLGLAPEPAGERFYRDIVDSSQEGVWIADADDRTTFVNARLAAMLGYAPAEMVGSPRSRFLSEEQLEAARVGSVELRLARRDGTFLWAMVESRPLFSPDGEVCGTRSSIIDVTRLREVEEHLRDREAQLSQAQRTARIGSWEWELATNRMHGSDEMFEILGMSAPLPAMSLQESLAIVHGEDAERVEAALRRAVSEDLPFDLEYRVRTKGGEKVVHSRGQRVLGPAGQAVRVVGVLQDMTDRKKLEERLQQAERVSSIGRLAASVAHEFNNILMGIQPFTELLARVSTQPDAVRNAASRISDAIARGKRVTQEILKFTRTPAPLRVTINVAGWLRSAEPELQQLAGREVAVSVSSGPGLHMLGDPHQLRQVLANLVVNARDAMPRGGTVSISALADPEVPGFIHFAVRDTGLGIPPETQRLIFEPLFTTKTFGGTGLGLAVTQQIIRQHDGRIWVESKPGEGATFHLLIPDAPERPLAATEPERSRRRSISRIALIEDDASVAAGIAAVLELEKVSVDIITRGREAVDRIAAAMPDAVVLDIGLPDIDGIRVYHSIAERWPELPVLFSTGQGDEHQMGRILTRPHVRFLQKPYDVDALLNAIEEMLP